MAEDMTKVTVVLSTDLVERVRNACAARGERLAHIFTKGLQGQVRAMEHSNGQKFKPRRKALQVGRPTKAVVGVFLCLLWAIGGCSGGKYYQSWPMESEVNGTVYHYHNAVQLNLPATMFHATQSMNWMEWCKAKLDDPKTEAEFLYPYRDCVRDDKYQLSTMGSVASQFVTPVLSTSMHAGALAYGLHQVGKGLGRSGDNVTQQGGNAEGGGVSQNNGNTSTSTRSITQTNNNTVKIGK